MAKAAPRRTTNDAIEMMKRISTSRRIPSATGFVHFFVFREGHRRSTQRLILDEGSTN
jgi:hypothetical protein